MSAPVFLEVYENQRLVFGCPLEEAVELGRQLPDEEGPYHLRRLGPGRWRLVVANYEETTVSRKHVLLEALGDCKVKLTNLRETMTVRLGDGSDLMAKASRDQELPADLILGGRTVRLRNAAEVGEEWHSLPEATLPPGQLSGSLFGSSLPAAVAANGTIDGDALVRWLRDTMDVLHSAATSTDFFFKAAQALHGMEMDTCLVLTLQKNRWRTEAFQTLEGIGSSEREPSRHVLERVRQEKKTFWKGFRQPAPDARSLADVKAVVAAPILNRQGEVIGVLYGDRRQLDPQELPPRITALEAMIVELLARGVATGLARMEQEQVALTERIRFEQFFTADLARQLQAQPDLVAKGRDAEVSILFCDIRGFSRISEKLGPAATVEWISDVLEVLSIAVLDHQGVLVDYIGDALMAMWGAPQRQEDHARQACAAALDMLAGLPALTKRWQDRLEEPVALGIGINTGPARVGNTGSKFKFKYGPLGNSVNLASRVQGATKYLKTPLLITGSTRQQLGPGFCSRKLSTVRVVNIDEAVDLHELAPAGQPGWQGLKEGYEHALLEFEQKNFRGTARLVSNLLEQHPEDGPSLVLLSRAVEFLVKEPAQVDLVWELPGK